MSSRVLLLIFCCAVTISSCSVAVVLGERLPTEREHHSEHHSHPHFRHKAATQPPIVFLPGFASTQLHSWGYFNCPNSPVDVYVGDRVWLSTSKVLAVDPFRSSCWIRCMMLQPLNQTDDVCKLRPATGLNAITELDPGAITGPLSVVFKSLFSTLVEAFDYGPENMIAATYDFRLPPMIMERRDRFFSRLVDKFERLRQSNNNTPSIVISHSLGGKVFGYFVQFVKATKPHIWQEWFDQHILAYFSVATPELGAVEAIRAAVTGITFGLPISTASAKVMTSSFGSSAWMLPMNDPRLSRGEPPYPGSAWNLPVVTIEESVVGDASTRAWLEQHSVEPEYYAQARTRQETERQAEQAQRHREHPATVSSSVAAPYFVTERDSQADDNVVDQSDIILPQTIQRFMIADVISGEMFQLLSVNDTHLGVLAEIMHKYYFSDPLFNALATPAPRPPVRHVYATYGINLRTPRAYRFAHRVNNTAPGGEFALQEEIYETIDGRWYAHRPGALRDTYLGTNGQRKGGDGTVPYRSLSWAHTWLETASRVHRNPVEVNRPGKRDYLPGLRWLMGPKKAHYNEYHGTDPHGRETTVVEFEGIEHRDIIRTKVHLDYLVERIGFLSGRLPHDTHLNSEIADDQPSASAPPASPHADTGVVDEMPLQQESASSSPQPKLNIELTPSPPVGTSTPSATASPAIALSHTDVTDLSTSELNTKAKLLQEQLASLKQSMEAIHDELAAYRAESERRHAVACAHGEKEEEEDDDEEEDQVVEVHE